MSTTELPSVSSLLGTTPTPSFKFPTPGTVLEGRILSARAVVRKDFATGQEMSWSDGSPRLQIAYTIAKQGTGEKVALFARIPSNLHKALRLAFISEGVEDPIGQVVRVEYTGDELEVGAQFPTKQFSAKVIL